MPHSESDRSRSRSDSRERNRHKEEEKVEEENCCLYIGNIDKRITQEKLQSIFRECGPTEYCYIVYEPHSTGDRNSKVEIKQSRGYGFAKFTHRQNALTAQEKLNGFDLNGRRLNVEFSKRPNPREATPGRYLGKKRPSPPRRTSKYRRSYSRSSSDSYRRRRYQQKRSRKYDRSRSQSHSRSRDESGGRRRRRSSYSRSPRR